MGFRSTAALYNHAQSSVQELQRFLSHQLRLVAARVPQALRRRIAALSVAAKERLRHLAAEVKTMAHETGILKRKRQALFQLKSKVRPSRCATFERRQSNRKADVSLDSLENIEKIGLNMLAY